jgi:UrcA family protein
MIRTFTTAALLAFTIASAQAGTMGVTFKDLDISSPAGSRILAQRVQAAAEQACGPAIVGGDNRPSVQTEADSDHRACVRRAAAQAMAQVQAAQPALAQAGAARTKLASQ